MARKGEETMKKFAVLLMLVCLVTALCACPNGRPNDLDTITVVDHDGNTVTLPKEIKKIVVADIFPLPSVLAVFFDSADKLVGIAPTSMAAAKNSLLSELYPEILNAKTDFMQGSTVNTEELAKLEPDVVFYSAGNAQQGENLRNAGFNAVAISANKWGYNAIETLNQWIDLLSQMFPASKDRAAIAQRASNEAYTLVSERVGNLKDEEKKNVFFIFQCNESTILTSGKNFFGQWWADAMGANNVAEELTKDNSVAVNLEQVIKWNPDVIFITNFTPVQPNDLYTNAIGNYDWSAISAIISHQVYKMPLGMYRSYTPGIDTPVTLLWFAKTVYPELFEDIDVIEEVIAYYDEVFGIELTEEQAKGIFAPSGNAGIIDY